MERFEEILEVAQILDETAEQLATVFERSGADKLPPPDVLREMARYELDLAAVDIARLMFRSNIPRGWR